MSSSFSRKIRYVKERCINAYWMLSEGKLKLILHSIMVELRHRRESLQTWLNRSDVLDDTEVPYSSYHDRRKVLPPSYRPTVFRAPEDTILQGGGELISQEIQSILSGLKVQEEVQENAQEGNS